ncbi:MAG: rhomboid family intramembrane serine protease [Dongiaceae bacterium]
MIPLRDDNPTTLQPAVTIALIVAASAVFLWQLTLSPTAEARAVYALGVIPITLLGDEQLPPDIYLVPPWLTVLTSMFLHGGWLHLIGNMLYLWIFGNNIEDALGHVGFVLFYLICGAAAALTQSVLDVNSAIPMIGASGAIAGVLGAYAVLYPRAHVLVLLPLGFFSQVIRLPALLVLGFWFVLQFIEGGLTASSAGGGVAYWAHIGGFVAGIVLIFLFPRRSPPAPWRRPRGPWE